MTIASSCDEEHLVRLTAVFNVVVANLRCTAAHDERCLLPCCQHLVDQLEIRKKLADFKLLPENEMCSARVQSLRYGILVGSRCGT